jgi:hypothetical protein
MILFIASSTDVIANFMHLSLSSVLWAMRILTFLVPLITYPVTYYLAKEMQHAPGSGKRKTTNVVSRSATGEYLAESAPAYDEDVHHELVAKAMPTFIEADLDSDNGVRKVPR